MLVRGLSGLALGFALLGSVAAVEPNDIYWGSHNDSSPNIALRIGNGGAGQSGLVKALADAFIDDSVDNGSTPFQVAWYTSDTTVTIRYLQSGTVDVGITYSEVAEQIAINQGIATKPSYYAFRDHFIIVGPPSNPANISSKQDILTLFTNLYTAAENGTTKPPVRFLSRFDKSATNIKESALWISIGQVPWATAVSTWYHQYIAFPLGSLTAAIQLEEYTLTDRGTYLSLPSNLTSKTTIWKESTDALDDPLLNPAHVLIGAKAAKPDVAKAFADWIVGSKGQAVITGFKKNGAQLYSGAPSGNETKKEADSQVLLEL